MDSTLIQVAIGLVLVYSLLSVVVSQANEMLRLVLSRLTAALARPGTLKGLPGRIFNWFYHLDRAGFLEEQLRAVLQDGDASPQKRQFVNSILQHPLIHLIQENQRIVRVTTAIEAAHLTTAIIQTAAQQAGAAPQGRPSAEPGADVPAAQAISEAAPTVGTSATAPMHGVIGSEYEFVLEKLPQSLQDLLKKVDRKVDDQTNLIQEWIKKQFDYMTIRFRRSQFWWSFFLGFLIAFVLNIDTLQITTVLWRDPTIRAALVQSASTLTLPDSTSSDTASTDTSASAQTADAETGTTTASNSGDTTQQLNSVYSALNELFSVNAPILWTNGEDTSQISAESAGDSAALPTYHSLFEPGRDPTIWANVLANGDMTILKFIGLLITAAAVSRGADFWFNLLRNLTRGSNAS
ncbi:MAG: hypothetical protein U0670_07855 [Anaerolineae bacterium]